MNEQKESKLYRVLENLGSIFWLNMLFIVFSIPVVTIGASVTALYDVMLRIVRKEEGAVTQGFVKAFRANFRQATIQWVLVMLAGIVLYGELIYITNFEGAIVRFYMILFAVESLLAALVLPFLFPLTARYQNTVWNTMKNSLLLAISNLGAWIKILLAWVAPVLISLFYPVVFFSTWYLWVVIGFGLIAFGTSHTVNRVFKKVTETQEKAKGSEKAKESGKAKESETAKGSETE